VLPASAVEGTDDRAGADAVAGGQLACGETLDAQPGGFEDLGLGEASGAVALATGPEGIEHGEKGMRDTDIARGARVPWGQTSEASRLRLKRRSRGRCVP
jgi:hypothetical protein